MYEKVNPSHPDKIADRIAGAILDAAYAKNENPRVAVEVLIGHGKCHIINETDTHLATTKVKKIVERIAGADIALDYVEVPQDKKLADNQKDELRCADNGIFKGCPTTDEQGMLSAVARKIYKQYPFDGKYIYDVEHDRIIICQSNADTEELKKHYDGEINPLGDWTGGLDVDTGATNRKLGSDMGDAVTGGGLHGKDLTKADVSLNIYAHLIAEKANKPIEISCAIGDDYINNRPYKEIVEIARAYIKSVGGFEKFAEWGLI